jgi:hypothetical protein
MKPLDAALTEWAAGNWYEAHEHLEEVAEALENDDRDYAIALALVQISASFHKLANNVAPRAVPAKMDRVMPTLEAAPPDWQGLALGTFVAETRSLRARLVGVAEGGAVPALEYPVLRRS